MDKAEREMLNKGIFLVVFVVLVAAGLWMFEQYNLSKIPDIVQRQKMASEQTATKFFIELAKVVVAPLLGIVGGYIGAKKKSE